MKRLLIAIAVLGLVIGGFFLWQVYRGAQREAQQREAVQGTVDNYLAVSKKGDIKAMYELLTASLRFQSPPPERAAAIIEERQKKAGKVVSWKIKKVEIKGDGQATAEVSVKTEHANYVSVFDLRTENGKWRIDVIRSEKTTD